MRGLRFIVKRRFGAMLTRVAALCLALIGLPALAYADNAAPSWVGVWHGTIGTQKVQVCLQRSDYGDGGAYYYLRHLVIIGLGTAEPNSAGVGNAGTQTVFAENGGPLWHITAVSAGHLHGTWDHGAKSLPIELDRMQISHDGQADQPCGDEVFSLPRFTAPVITTRLARLMGITYNRVLINPGKQFADSGSETFQLSGTTPAIRRVNADLYKVVPTGHGNAEYFNCSMSALGQNGTDGVASSILQPVVLTSSWLVLQNAQDENCGGAHPDYGLSYATWDLRSGTQVNLYDWFTKAALTQTINDPDSANAYVTVTFTPAFRKLIDTAYPRDNGDCTEEEAGVDIWQPHLTPKGIAFTPLFPHALMSCSEDAVVPFASLVPYLTPIGKTQLAGFRAEIGGSK